MNYTMPQIELYLREALRHEGEAQAAAIMAVNLGFTGGQKANAAISKLNAG